MIYFAFIRSIGLAIILFGLAVAVPSNGADRSVFDGATAHVAPWLSDARPTAEQPLRVLTVEVRVGVARQQELVRVPLFFHAGECRDVRTLGVYAADDREHKRPLVVQADDIRRAENGDIAALHLYFATDLAPWESRTFQVVVASAPQNAPPPLKLEETPGRVTLAGDDLQVTFWKSGPRAGAIAALHTKLGDVTLPHEQLAPRVVLTRQTADLKVVRKTPLTYIGENNVEVQELQYGAGPLFAKFRVRVNPRGIDDCAEYTYRVPRHGDWFTQAQRLFPAEESSTDVVGAEMNFLLQGRLLLGEEGTNHEIVPIPAGLRKLVRSVHGHTTPAVVNTAAQLSLLPIPNVQVAVPGIAGGGQEGYVSIEGPQTFQRTSGANSNSLRSFWTEVRYVFTNNTAVEDLWQTSLAHRQPLVAIVDEPWLTRDDLHARFATMMAEWPPHHSRDWRQEIGRLYVVGDQEAFAKRLKQAGKPGEDTQEYWLAGAQAAYDKLTNSGATKPKEWEKGRASGGLDPWHLTYAGSCAPLLSSLVEPNDHVDRVALAIARAQQKFNGRVDEFGFAYVDCFNSAFNMQIGSVLMGLHGGRRLNDPKLMQFYRDVATSASVLDIYGHGERTYPSLRSPGGTSDALYQMTSDFYLRTAEIATGEDLWLHPMVHGRYADMVDVNTDQMHRDPPPSDAKRTPSWNRANFFRGQSHDHRWEAWATGPFARLVARREATAPLVGLTDAIYYAQHLVGQPKNWVEITTYLHADLASDPQVAWPKTPPAPPLPKGVQVSQGKGGQMVTWQAVPGEIAGYRLYRAKQMGGPWTFVNSPYREPAGTLIAGTSYLDTQGNAGDVYFVTAVDKSLRESKWFAEEPSR